MKTIILVTGVTMLLLSASTSFAASCADTQNAAGAAIKERNAYAVAGINAAMPDPEDMRGAFAGCLSSINSLGGAFSLGVSLPGMDQIVAGMCNQVDSLLQEKIHDVMSQVRSTVNGIGGNNPFQVSGGGSMGATLARKLK